MSYPMNIGEAAQAAGLTPKMIRDYEALGLIPQASRTESGYRQYTKRDVDMLRFIRQARSMSFSIKQVEQLLSLWSDTERESSDVKALAQAQLAELDRKIAELASMKAALEQIASSCPGDHTADCPILTKLSGNAAPAALSGERRRRQMPARAHSRRAPANGEAASYAGLLAWSQTLKGGLGASRLAQARRARPPPVTLTLTWGARRTTVASIRDLILAARCASEATSLGLRRHLDDAVVRVEKAFAPLNDRAVDL